MSVNLRPNGDTCTVSTGFRNNNLRILALFSRKARLEKKKGIGVNPFTRHLSLPKTLSASTNTLIGKLRIEARLKSRSNFGLTQESWPSLRRRFAGPRPISGHGGLRHCNSQFQQFCVNPRCTHKGLAWCMRRMRSGMFAATSGLPGSIAICWSNARHNRRL